MTDAAIAQGERLAELYREIHRRSMAGLPICNEALEVEAVGFRPFGELVVGVIVTPWFANLVAVAAEGGTQPLRLRFPAGDVEFNVSALAGFGSLASCSIFSPMSDFVDHEAAREAAQAALAALFDPHLHEAPSPRAERGAMDRRALFGGRRRASEEAAP
jgi:[NiFe] hydrogenase assembly HybE family chaperone